MRESDAIRDELIRCLPRLRRFARVLTGADADAEDLVQDTIERALKSAGQWTPGTHLDRWLFRIARNAWIDRARMEKRRGAPIDVDALTDLAGEDGRATVDGRHMLQRVQTLVAALPADQRAVLGLVAIEGRSYREAADILETPVGTVMSRLARARRALSDALRLDDAGGGELGETAETS